MNSKYISLIVLSFILVLVAGISFLSIEKSDVEEVYAATPPSGFVLMEANVLYENVEYWIDTSYSLSSITLPSFVSGVSRPRIASGSTISGRRYWVSTFGSENDIYLTSGSSWLSSSFSNGVVVGFPTLNIGYVEVVPWLYVKQSASSPVTQSLPITFDSGVESVSLGNQTWNSSGASNSVVFDDENNTYTFNVTLNNSVLRSVTYNLSSDTTIGGILNATISGSSFTCECPVGDSIESITIYTDSLIYSSPCVITFDEYIQKVECDGIEWTASGQSNDIYYDLTSGSMLLTFDVTLNNGYIVDDYSIRVTSGLMTSSLNGNQLTVSGISSSGDSIQSISFTSELLTVGIVSYVQTWSPNVSGDYTGQIDYSGLSGILNLPAFTISAVDISFSNYVELYEYIFGLLQNSGGSVVLTNVMQYQVYGVRYFDDTEVSFPLTYDNYDSSKGGLVFLTRRKISTVSFSQPSLFGYFPASETFEDGKFPFNSSYDMVSVLTYYVAPYMFGSNWSLITKYGDYDLLSDGTTPVRLYIDGVLWGIYNCSVYRGRELANVSMAINLNPVSTVLTSLTQENLVFYYLDSVVYYDNIGSTDYTELYFSSGSSNWQPTIYDSFDLLGRIFDGVLDILDIHLTADITLKTILLIVLSLGILLFVFRISGVF